MTPTDANREAVEVVQCDREAAARWAKLNSRHQQAANIRRGSCDTAPIVQAFARHRIAATAQLTAERDAALRDSIKWAREAGEAKGLLEGRDGILELRERCERMDDALREIAAFAPGVTHGWAVNVRSIAARARASEDRHGG